jgi:hypothetical protein
MKVSASMAVTNVASHTLNLRSATNGTFSPEDWRKTAEPFVLKMSQDGSAVL